MDFDLDELSEHDASENCPGCRGFGSRPRLRKKA